LGSAKLARFPRSLDRQWECQSGSKAMTVDQWVAQVRALETQLSLLKVQITKVEAHLAVLKAELRGQEASAPTKTFRDLHGIFAGQLDLAEGQIDSALYRFDWEDDESAGTRA
jgi:hypothetical protein